MDERVVIGGDLNLSNVIDGDMSLLNQESGDAGVFMPIYPNAYTGVTTITPGEETQILQTEGLMMSTNVTINPIPSNYGRITWNGTTLTVS